MNLTSTRIVTPHVPFLLALLAIGAVTSSARAADPASMTRSTNEPAGLRSVVSAPFDRILFDEAGDGVLWVRGGSFKARFDGSGATIVPFFGSDAPRNFPLELRVNSVTVGTEALHVATASKATREGNRVQVDRGSFVEQYDIALDSLEQRFVFETLPRTGEIVLRMNAQSELVGSDLGASLRFENDLGHVDYGEAFAVDAKGRKIALDSTLVDGVIQLVVPADFVASATLPLTIDPLVTLYTVSGGTHAELAPDVSYDATSDRWCVVWVDVYSASDYDVYSRLVTGNGTLMSYLTVDSSFDFWTTPRIANNNSVNDFLVVCAVTTPTSVSSIRGRILDPVNLLAGPQFLISPNDGAYRDHPDVGGDQNDGAFSSFYYCVVWQRPVNIANVDIEMQMVTTNSTLQGAMTPIDNSAQYDTLPRISKSIGKAAIAQTYAWTVVWQRNVTTNDNDIYGAQILWWGGILHSTFPIDTSFQNDTLPMVSTMMDPLTFDEHPYMVVYQRAYTDNDIMASVLKGNVLLLNVDLSGTFPAPFGNYNQTLPSVDCDGTHFLVANVEQEAFPSTDTNIWISDYYLSGSSLAACATHQSFAASTVAESAPSVCAMGSNGGARQHFFAAWTYASINNSYDVQGGVWDSCDGANRTPFCSGDGPTTPCPCNNHGASSHGCSTSQNAAGAYLTSSGNATISQPTFVLEGSEMPPGSPCLYFQGTSDIGGGAGITFGDGILCVGGTTIRLGVKFNDASGNSAFTGAPSNVANLGGLPVNGGTRVYQVWFRDAAVYCTGANFNLTNGLRVEWGW